MKHLIKSTILTGACLCALLLVQVTPVQAIIDCSNCTGETPCSTACFDFETTTCREGGPACCEDSVTTGPFYCNVRHFKSEVQVCKERFWSYDQIHNYCNNSDTYSFTLLFGSNYSSTEEQCPEFNSCPA
jgi:hypothetical protein